jgi:TolA-binding protein
VNDPARIRDGGSDAPPELRELFLDAKQPEPLTPAADARLAAQISALGALPAAPLGRVVPWLVAGGAVVVVGALALVAGRAPAPTAAPSPPLTNSAPAPAAPDAVQPAAPEAPAPSERKPSPAASARPAEAASSSGDALAGEAKLLNQAHAAMASDPQKAHAIASEHAKRYPRGQLAAERELILVQALVKLGRAREAEARGRALRKSTPSSIYGERLDAILKGK